MSYDLVTSEIELEKTTFDEEVFTANFEDRLVDGDTIATVDGVTAVPSGGPVFTGIVKDATNKKVQFKASAGSEGKYVVRVDINTTNANKIRGEMILHIRDAPIPS